jgi:hypothetical protein
MKMQLASLNEMTFHVDMVTSTLTWKIWLKLLINNV